MPGLEYEQAFEQPNDAMDRLRKDYDDLVKEYGLLYVSYMDRLENDKKKTIYYIDKNPKNLADIETVRLSIKTARKRALKEGI